MNERPVHVEVFGPWAKDDDGAVPGGYDVQIHTPAGMLVIELGADFQPYDFSVVTRSPSAVAHWKPSPTTNEE